MVLTLDQFEITIHCYAIFHRHLEPFILDERVNNYFYWDTHDTTYIYGVDHAARELKEIEDEKRLGRQWDGVWLDNS